MMEHWIVYDLASGHELWRGSGAPGSGAAAMLPEGTALIVVPQAVIRSPDLDFDTLRAFLSVQVDAEAEAVRQRFLTPGAGQAMTYARKEAEARAWVADNTSPTPFLSAEAPARGMTITALAAEVIALADAWVAVGSAIEAKRMGAKAAIDEADTLAGIVVAARIDWSMADAPAT